jgi:hypothetical protein
MSPIGISYASDEVSVGIRTKKGVDHQGFSGLRALAPVASPSRKDAMRGARLCNRIGSRPRTQR